MALVKDYFEKTKQYIQEYGEKTVVLMQVGAFFEIYGLKEETEEKDKNNVFYGNATITGSRITEISKICDLNVTEKKMNMDQKSVVMAGFKDACIDKYLKKLQDAGYTVVVYVQDEAAANTTRSLAGIFSPGTYFSCEPDHITNNCCCIWIEVMQSTLMKKFMNKKTANKEQVVYVGVSNIDIYTGKTSMFEFQEKYIQNPTTFDELERFITIYKPSETILISNLSKKEIHSILNYANITSTSIHFVSLQDPENKNTMKANNCEKQIYQRELLERFYKIHDFNVFIQDFQPYTFATQSFCYLLDFVFQHNPNLVNTIKEPIFENFGERLILANHSLKQLNIVDDDKYHGKYSSVVKMLNECVTPMGKRKFEYSFLNPITNKEVLQKEYNITEHILQNPTQLQHVRVMLSTIKDISKINRQLFIKKITPKTIVQLLYNLKQVNHIHEYIQGDIPFMNYLREKMFGFDHLLVYTKLISDFIESHLEVEVCKEIDTLQNFEINFIQKGVNLELDQQVQTLEDSQDKLESCRTYLNENIMQYEKSTGNGNKKKTTKKISAEEECEKTTEYIKIHETEKNNFTLVATEKRCKILKEFLTEQKKEVVYLHYQSSYSGETKVFELHLKGKHEIDFAKQSSTNHSISNPQISQLCKLVSTIKIGLKEQIQTVYMDCIRQLEQYQDAFQCICDFVTYIDMVCAKAWIASKYHYCKPEIVDREKSFVNVEDLRHCLIENIQQSELYVANDVVLGDGNQDGILLYGTNAVGKTSFIRSLGIAVIMAQAGLFVPASRFQYYPYRYIFTRILGNDNLFEGLSTFGVEMSELRTILRLADEGSLVLGDELCSGTESISAMSIFVAGIQFLDAKKCSFIFATHLHEIIHYEEITELERVSLKHMSVVYDKESDRLVYDRKLRDGPGTSMYGLEVCKSLALPEEFLEVANEIRMKYHPENASVLMQKTSHYNAQHIKTVCEKCGIHYASEVHHLQHQKEADEEGMIKKKGFLFHKNHQANLYSLCEKCHEEFHKSGNTHKKTKTTKGYVVNEMR